MAGSSEERAIAVAGSEAAPGWVPAWGAAERGLAPRAGLSAFPPHALWFLALWHLLTVWTWAWGGAGNEEGVGRRAACAAVCGAECGAGLEAKAAPGAEDDLGGMLMGKEGGTVGGT